MNWGCSVKNNRNSDGVDCKPEFQLPNGPGSCLGDIAAWEVLKTEDLCIAAPWIKLSVQQLRLPDGTEVDDYHQVSLGEFVIIFPWTGDERVVMERQYKHGLGKVTLTLPSGLIEDGEEPMEAARRELMEETGYASDQWKQLGSFVVHGNYGCGRAHLFKATDACRFKEPASGDLEEMDIVLMNLDEIKFAFKSGDIGLLGTMATIALATNPLFCWANSD